jgi:hypothetical protein
MMPAPSLPNRRACETRSLAVGNTRIMASIGLDPAGTPREVFLSGAKDGSGLAAILDVASVAISVALQYGVLATRWRSRSPGSGPQRYRRARSAPC